MFFRCLMIEMDSDGLVSKYSIQDAARRHYYKEDQIHECLTPFFDERELKHIVNISPKFKTPLPNTVTHVPGTPVRVADEEALRAIERAWDQEGKTLEGLDLLAQAEAAAGPPECDSVRAKILADKAYQVILESNP